MSITKRYTIFDKMDQEETMALSREKPTYNALIQDINNSFCIEQNSNEIDNDRIHFSSPVPI